MTAIRCIILAGGSGKRLWPISTPEKPKQLLTIGNKTLFEATMSRALTITDPYHCTVVTTHAYVHALNLLEPMAQYIVEAEARNTGPAYCAALLETTHDAAETVIVGMPSDHVIEDIATWTQTMLDAISIAQRHDQIVLLGAPPRHPSSEYGYIACDATMQVIRFHEKPDLMTAETYTAPTWWWHTGIWIARRAVIMKLVEETASTIIASLITQDYSRIPAIPWDKLIFEKSATQCRLVALNTEWHDVGTIEQFLAAQQKAFIEQYD